MVPEDSREREEKQETEKQMNSWPWFVLAAIALLILIYEAMGRQRIHKRLASFAAIHTDEQVYKMYAYAGRVMAFDGHPLPENPYDQLEELSTAYDAVTDITLAEFLRLVNRVRFSEGHLLEEEYETMNRYVRNLAKHVYGASKAGKKFLMKWVRFYI